MPPESPATTDCPPDIVFVELFEGRLTGPTSARLLRHTELCSACRALLDALTARSGQTWAGRATAESLDDSLSRALLQSGTMPGTTSQPGSEARPRWGRPASWLGETIGGTYRLLGLLGEGGMGSVYEAEHAGTRARVAVKLINSRLLVPGSAAPRRFRREARAAGAIDSPHIVRIIDSGVDEATGNLFLVMEVLRGEDLQHLVDRAGPLPPEVALRIVAQALLGLQKAHEAGVVHRDIKPANLFLAQGDDGEITVKLLDFGIAKLTVGSLEVSQRITHTGGFLGSPLYVSPEQAQSSKAVDHRTDLWSLGSALYCALAGRPPHAGVASMGRLIVAICNAPAQPIRELAPWVAPEIADAVHGALAIDPERRYPSAAAMLDAIRPLVSDGLALRKEMLVGKSAGGSEG